MDKAIEILTAMLNELKGDAEATYMGTEYYKRMNAKIDAIEEAIARLENKKRQAL